jgi:hypothetical protein
MPDISRFDLSRFDKLLFDDASLSPPIPPRSTDSIQFNGFGLQNVPGNGFVHYRVTDFIYSGPTRALGEAAYPRADGEYIQTDYWRKAKIVLKGTVFGTSKDDMEAHIDLLKQNLAVGNGLLYTSDFGGSPRVWNCYADISKLVDTRRYYNVTFCHWEVDFLITLPFARSPARRVVAPVDPMTVSPTVYDTVQNAGTATSKGIWTFLLNVVGSCNQLTLTNLTTSEAIIISGTFANNDIIMINGETATVTQNANQVDFTGVFPSIAPGLNTFTVAPNGAGFTIYVQEQNYDLYL